MDPTGAPSSERWAAIAPVLDAALDLPPERRASFVAERCGADPGLRREVERVLAAAERAESFLETPAAVDASPLVARIAREERRAPGDRLGAYTLERELGRGGMATVYLARDGRHDRLVALKVLDEELSYTLGADRFARETAIAARLNHPHVLPLFDSGVLHLATGSLLYYAMPYVEGRSLRERLRQEPRLPIDTAVAIGRQISAALDHAHQHGVIHRDIKPENVLLAGDHAFVADFGIALALDAAGGDRLTRTGLSLGTPAYMSPEQATTGRLDGRSDLYSLGCVLYEMLAGQPPFTGSTARAVLAQHATQPVPPLRTLRPSVSPALEQVILRALAKLPDDRFPTGGDLASALAAPPAIAAAPEPDPPAISAGPRRRTRRGTAALAVAVVGAVAALALLQARPTSTAVPAPDPLAVAVTPFKVSSAAGSLGYSPEAIAEQLSIRMSGTQAAHPVETDAVVRAWRSLGDAAGDPSGPQAQAMARRVGASELVAGEVIGSGPRVSLSSSLIDVAERRVVARETVEGPADSMPALLDRLAARLLPAIARVDRDERASLSRAALPAVRAYLEGEAMDRRNQSDSAAMRFKEALRADSTCALAALHLIHTTDWPDPDSAARAIAWRYREQLSPPDRADLTVTVGARYPAPSPLRETVAAAEHYVEVAPRRPQAWQGLGFELLEKGPLLGLPEALARAASAFARAVELDSTSAPALLGLSLIAAVRGDTGTARHALTSLRRVRDTVSLMDFDPAWLLAATTGDTAEQRRLLRRDSLAPLVTAPASRGATILSLGLAQGLDVRDADRALERALAAAATETQRSSIRWNQRMLDDIRGHLGRKGTGLPAFPRYVQFGGPVLGYLLTDGDSTGWGHAGAGLLREIGSARSDECCIPRFAAGEYALATNRLALAQRAATDLLTYHGPALDADSAFATPTSHAYGVILAAQLAARRHDPTSRARLDALDSLLANPLDTWMPCLGNLIAARLHEERGERELALAALRRRAWGLVCPPFVVYHREEGRLAALTGDTAGAVRAYRRYLALRGDADPPLQARVREVRRALAALERGGTAP